MYVENVNRARNNWLFSNPGLGVNLGLAGEADFCRLKVTVLAMESLRLLQVAQQLLGNKF